MSDVFAAALRRNGVPPASIIAQRTDEEWALHDQSLTERIAAQAARDRADERARRSLCLVDNGFPRRAIKRVMANQIAEVPATVGAREFVAAPDRTLLVLGGAMGAGKTTATTWVAMESPEQATDGAVAYVRASELEARGRFEAVTLREWLHEKQLLVVDDLGTEVEDPRFAVLLNEIVDMFYGNERRLVVATNLAVRAFMDRYGERVLSRLNESGTWCDCGTVDLRKEPAT